MKMVYECLVVAAAAARGDGVLEREKAKKRSMHRMMMMQTEREGK